MENATLMLATSQLGITVCSLLILLVSEPAVHHLLEGPLGALGLSPVAVSTVAFILALLIVSYLHVVLGEMVPKNISFSVPDKAVLLLAPPLVFVSKVFQPVIGSLNAIANGILRLTGVEPKAEAVSAYTLDEVATIVAESTKTGMLADHSGALSAAFEFTTKKVRDVTIAFEDVVTLPEDTTPGDVHQAVAQRGYSRYVLVNEANQPTGYVHIKDMLDVEALDSDYPVPPRRIRRLVTLHDDVDLEDALATLRHTGAHVAKVIDDQGTMSGILFLEDIIEELVGEVRDATTRY
jgi:CBS domain containing-hemolysin-like protein